MAMCYQRCCLFPLSLDLWSGDAYDDVEIAAVASIAVDDVANDADAAVAVAAAAATIAPAAAAAAAVAARADANADAAPASPPLEHRLLAPSTIL